MLRRRREAMKATPAVEHSPGSHRNQAQGARSEKSPGSRNSLCTRPSMCSFPAKQKPPSQFRERRLQLEDDPLPRRHTVILRKLARIELYDQLFADYGVDLLTSRSSQHPSTRPIHFHTKPLRYAFLGHGRDYSLEVLTFPATLTHANNVADLDLRGRYVRLAASEAEMPMPDQLPGLIPRRSPPHPVDHVIEPHLQDPQQVLAGNPRAALGFLKVLPELTLQHPVDVPDLLLLFELRPVLRDLSAPALPMLTGTVVPALHRALRTEALVALQEQLHALPPAQAAN